MEEKIEILFKTDGTTEITTKGFKGKGCMAATQFLKAALGKVSRIMKTPEYHQQEQQATWTTVRR
jgi:hypothetical protein